MDTSEIIATGKPDEILISPLVPYRFRTSIKNKLFSVIPGNPTVDAAGKAFIAYGFSIGLWTQPALGYDS